MPNMFQMKQKLEYAIEKDNIELRRLGKTLKNVPKYISMSQLTEEVIEEG